MVETATVLVSPGLETYRKSLKSRPLDANISDLVRLLRLRQIRSSHSCALATAYLLKRVVGESRVTDPQALIKRVSQVGKQLTAAQPREIAVGNVVRRVLHSIRQELGQDRQDGSGTYSEAATEDSSQHRHHIPSLSRSQELPPRSPVHGLPEDIVTPLLSEAPGRPSLMSSSTSYAASSFAPGNTTPGATSMFSLLSRPVSHAPSPSDSPRTGHQSPVGQSKLTQSTLASLDDEDLRQEIIGGVEEFIEELESADRGVSDDAAEHIHSNEIVMTYGPSSTIQKFLLVAARKRKFTLFYVEGYPNLHAKTHQATIKGIETSDPDEDGGFLKPLTAAGITVVLVPDSSVFAIMSRVNKVILDTHVVLANGGLVATAGAKAIAMAAQVHSNPVVAVSPIYKLSPIHPVDFDALVEQGDPSAVLDYSEGDLLDKVEVENPLYDYVPPELVDLYITSLGGHAPSYLYRLVADHYSADDTDLADLD